MRYLADIEIAPYSAIPLYTWHEPHVRVCQQIHSVMKRNHYDGTRFGSNCITLRHGLPSLPQDHIWVWRRSISIYWRLPLEVWRVISEMYPDNKVHGAHMGPTWVLSAPGGPHVGPMNLAIRVVSEWKYPYFIPRCTSPTDIEHSTLLGPHGFITEFHKVRTVKWIAIQHQLL